MSTTNTQDTITYIITVHGIGAQRDNETISPVVSRLVDVITDLDGKQKNSYPRNTLSLGQITGQEQANPNEHWAAFTGLSLAKLRDGDENFIFYGVEAQPHDKPDLIRFCDIHWQDILQKHWVLVGESADKWVSTVVSRVFQNDSHPARLKSLMYTLEETVDLLYYASKLRKKDKDLSRTVFEEYLGDVQLYTESHGCRADAIARFHERMNSLHSAVKDHRPRYIIIAHSLGTTMSLDALLDGARKNLPWMQNVEAFVTLGSPIDKIITLWDFNYDDLATPIPFGKKIASYNYSDEQDPVGYYLNEIVKKPAYRSVFEKKEDIVYNHSVIPGKAHVDYWTDIELFRHIVRKIIAPKKAFDDVKMWFKGKVYTGVMFVTYFFIPLFVAGLNVLTLSWALGADSWQARALNSVAFVASSWFGKQLLSLVISWRLAGNRGKDARPYCYVKEDNEALQKLRFQKGSNLMLWSIMAVSILAPAYLFIMNPWRHHLLLTWEKLWPILTTIVLSFIAIFFFFMNKRKQQTLMREMAGRAFTADLSTVLTIVLSAWMFIASLAKHDITLADKEPAKTSALSIFFNPFTFTSSAYAQTNVPKQEVKPIQTTVPRQQEKPIQTTVPQKPRTDTTRRSVNVFDTVRHKIDVYDTVVSRTVLGVTDTTRKFDTLVRTVVKYDTLSKRDTILTVAAPVQDEGALLYFSAVMTCFTCFTNSSLRYFFEKGKIKKMKKVVAESVKQQ
jgi:hypothetical protein